jgi:hypothetical protein
MGGAGQVSDLGGGLPVASEPRVWKFSYSSKDLSLYADPDALPGLAPPPPPAAPSAAGAAEERTPGAPRDVELGPWSLSVRVGMCGGGGDFTRRLCAGPGPGQQAAHRQPAQVVRAC